MTATPATALRRAEGLEVAPGYETLKRELIRDLQELATAAAVDTLRYRGLTEQARMVGMVAAVDK